MKDAIVKFIICLTASACFQISYLTDGPPSYDFSNYTIVVGKHDIYKLEQTRKVSAVKIKIHLAPISVCSIIVIKFFTDQEGHNRILPEFRNKEGFSFVRGR